jgi:hypothetical protein
VAAGLDRRRDIDIMSNKNGDATPPPLAEPLGPPEARALLRSILATGRVSFSAHALQEMAEDGISEAEVIGVLRSGVVEPAELVRSSWRYRVRTSTVYAVVTFRSAAWTVVVTAWRTSL